MEYLTPLRKHLDRYRTLDDEFEGGGDVENCAIIFGRNASNQIAENCVW
jgi:hypothetical protein